MFIIGSWAFAALSVIWMLGIVTIAILYCKVTDCLFEFKLNKKKGEEKKNI